MTPHRAFNLFLVTLISAVLGAAHLLDGPTELEAAQAVQADAQDAIKSVAIDARLTLARGQIDQQDTVVAAVQP